jgi:alpha-D-ribose 1-methylphosphonate 5-triphosphate diphosphatase
MRRLITAVDLVTPDCVVRDGSLLVEDGRITALCPVAPAFDRELEGAGALCLPGLIDLHCDALEKEVEPRPKVAFEHGFALVNSDRRNLNAGITTVYHAISFAGGEWGVRDPRIAEAVVREVRGFAGLVDHKVHARFEVTDDGSEAPLADLLADGQCDLLSFMDHSPGQGQFSELAAYVAYMTRTYHVSEAEAVAIGTAKIESRRLAPERMARLAALARSHGVALASHDDDTPAKVAEMAALGVTISEFPIGLEAAQAAVAAGMVTLFGSPNVLRGRSASGNVRALDVILAGACTGLCADYHPPSLLAAVLRLPEISPLGLPAAVRLATLAPARAAGLADRGALAPGQRADLLLVRAGRVEAALVAGRKVLDTIDRPACV